MNKVNEKAKLWRYKKVVGPIYFYLGHNIDVHKTLPFYKLSTQMEFLKKTFQEVRPELVPLAYFCCRGIGNIIRYGIERFGSRWYN